MKRLALLLGALAAASLTIAPSVSAEFGLEDFGMTVAGPEGGTVEAGSHPYAIATRLSFRQRVNPTFGAVPDGAAKDLELALPTGLIGDPDAVPRCPGDAFLDVDSNTKLPNCPDSSALGVASIRVLLRPADPPTFVSAPIFNLTPSPGMVQKMGFTVYGVPVAMGFTVNPDPPHNIAIAISNLSQAVPVYDAALTIWGNPSDPEHDRERGSCIFAGAGDDEGIHTTGEVCSIDLGGDPYLTLPRTCSGTLGAGYRLDSWSDPGAFLSGRATVNDGATPPQPLRLSGCADLGFSPAASVQPTNDSAESPTGLAVAVNVEDEGLTSAAGRAQSDIERATITLPQGISINAAAAAGLGACSPSDLERETLAGAPGEGCPNAAKIGTAEADSVLLGEPLKGSIFLAQPDDPFTLARGSENPFDSLFALYVVLRNAGLGVLVKQPVEVEADPASGRLVATAADLPQFPFRHLRLRFREGERAPLTTPASCGLHIATTHLVPRSDPARSVTASSSFRITEASPDGQCPRDVSDRPFEPRLRAGTLVPIAGARTPFTLNLSRAAGSQPLSAFRVRLPPGLTAAIAGIPYCSRLCSEASEVGTVTVGAGAGSFPIQLQGSAYLAGPYKGAPVSLAMVVPALAGPFDLGTVLVRAALHVDSETAQIEAVADPLPTILRGVPLNVRSIALKLDRPGFLRSPTGCKPTAVVAEAESVVGQSRGLLERFQVGDCARLGFRPRARLRLLGPTHRGGHPKLRAVLLSRPGDAGISRAAVTLPGAQLLESRHIGKVCALAEFAAAACPRGAVVGHVKAWTPLLDRPLAGPVYLRSGDHELPDLAVSLDGQIDLDLTGHVEAVGGRLRIVFPTLPDVPFSKLVIAMKGGGRACSSTAAGFARGTGAWRRSLARTVERGCGSAPSCRPAARAKKNIDVPAAPPSDVDSASNGEGLAVGAVPTASRGLFRCAPGRSRARRGRARGRAAARAAVAEGAGDGCSKW